LKAKGELRECKGPGKKFKEKYRKELK